MKVLVPLLKSLHSAGGLWLVTDGWHALTRAWQARSRAVSEFTRLPRPFRACHPWLATALVCCGCLLQATTSTTLVGVKVSATFPGAGSVAGAAPAAYDASEGPPNEETVTYTASGKPLKITVRLTKEEDFNSPRQLLVNDKDYGTVTTADEVHVQGDEVKVNGTVRTSK